jgi:hypothetical protein
MRIAAPGFNPVTRTCPPLAEAMENVARYIVRASFSQERMTYLPDESKVLYRSRDGKNEKTFDALEWLAAMCSHVPFKGGQAQQGGADGQVLWVLQ